MENKIQSAICAISMLVFAAVQQAKADSWINTGAMTTTRFVYTMTLLPDGKILAAGGGDSSGDILSSAELYDPALGTWTATSPMNHARGSHTATFLPNGKLLVAGGEDSSGLLSSAELFDPATGTWTDTGPLNDARAGHRATLLANGLVLVEGGIDSSSADSASAEIYDPNTGTWTYTGSLNQGRVAQTATLLVNGTVLVAGGSSGPTGLSSAEVYDPVTGTWTMTGALNAIHFLHTANLLPDGMVLVAGGYAYGNGPSTPISELYDPATGTWTMTGALNYGRWNHIAILLLNGKVLVAGGSSHDLNEPDLGWLTPTELYDPATGTWMLTSDLNTGRADFAGTLLPNGTVLVAGGDNGSGVISSAELFTSEGADTTLTVTANPQTQVYWQADPPLTYVATGFQNGDTAATVLTGALTRAPGETVAGGPYAITQGTLVANGNYTIVFTPSALTITPATLTVTPNAVSTTYDGAALGDANYSDNTGNYLITGFRNGESISSAGVALSGSMDFNGSTSATVENTGSYALTAGTLALSSAYGNYVMSFSNPSLNAYVITPATLTVTANSLTKTYGSPDPTLTYSVSGLQGSDTAGTVLTGSLARTPGADVGTYTINQGTLAANANYTINFVPGTLTITEVQLTITWPANIVISTGGACSTANLPALNIGTPAYTPSIPDVTVTATRSDGLNLSAPYPVGITTVTWTVTDVDDGGYSASYNQTVEVTDDVSISGSFNGTRIPAGSTIWFTAVLTAQLPRNVTGPVTIWFFAQNITSSAFNLAVPNATVVFDPKAPAASAACDTSGRWTTRAPGSGLAGNTLLATYAYQLPPGQSLPGGLQPVKWDGTFATDTPGVTIEWQWSAAVYSQFGNCSNAGVKSTDDSQGDCNYKNSDPAGTPENYKFYVIGSGQGGGGLNGTGSPCGAKAVVPCVESTAP